MRVRVRAPEPVDRVVPCANVHAEIPTGLAGSRTTRAGYAGAISQRDTEVRGRTAMAGSGNTLNRRWPPARPIDGAGEETHERPSPCPPFLPLPVHGHLTLARSQIGGALPVAGAPIAQCDDSMRPSPTL